MFCFCCWTPGLLNVVPDGIYVDCTLGGAGHSNLIASRLSEKGRLIGIDRPFLSEVCETVIKENANAYPNLVEKQDYIKKVIAMEEESFYKTIDSGLGLLNEMMEKSENFTYEHERARMLSDDPVIDLEGEETRIFRSDLDIAGTILSREINTVAVRITLLSDRSQFILNARNCQQ